jgi:hypothetical protein
LITRRRFLQVGLAGAAILIAGRVLYRPSRPAHSRALDERGVELIAALAPVVLAGALPSETSVRAKAIEEVVEAFDQAVAGLSPAVQSELRDLFGLLSFAPARMALAGVWSPWHEADEGAIAGFLDRWRASRFDLLRAGYQALTQLLQAAWYGNPRAWSAIGYSGPPKLRA